jgi:hypothetical protein
MWRKLCGIMKQFDTIYINGSSLSCGGGLEPDSPPYKHYVYTENIKQWSNSKSVSYGNVLGDMLGKEVINESKQGGGLDRLIRKTYDFILNTPIDKLEKILFLFDIPLQPTRIEIYSNQYEDYLVCSVALDSNGNQSTVEVRSEGKWWDSKLSISRGFFRPELRIPYVEYVKHDKILNDYITGYYNKEIEIRRMMRELTMFYSFMDSFKLNYVRDSTDNLFAASSNINDEKLKMDYLKRMEEHASFNPNVIDCQSIWGLSQKMKWTIADETPINDAHLGYYGNKKYAEYLFEKIKYL